MPATTIPICVEYVHVQSYLQVVVLLPLSQCGAAYGGGHRYTMVPTCKLQFSKAAKIGKKALYTSYLKGSVFVRVPRTVHTRQHGQMLMEIVLHI